MPNLALVRRASLCLFVCVVCAFEQSSFAGEIVTITDESVDWPILELVQGSTRVRLAPTAGANAYSIKIDGKEYFRQPDSLSKLPGAGFGNPILYPTPNRVRDAALEFRGKKYAFKPNAGKNFIHGLVNRQPWTVIEKTSDKEFASVTCQISFREKGPLHARFPFSHQLFVTVRVSEKSVRWDYVVKADEQSVVPFGFALHPYFLYQGDRKNTYLTVPATHMMESQKRLPTGKLLGPSDLDFPLGKPMSLKGTKFDDVFLGMSEKLPTRIEFRDKNESIEIRASDDFTHLVVWTPDRPYFGIENQTCSTDAHNMDHQGHKDIAHLQICEPNRSMTGWVEYRFLTD